MWQGHNQRTDDVWAVERHPARRRYVRQRSAQKHIGRRVAISVEFAAIYRPQNTPTIWYKRGTNCWWPHRMHCQHSGAQRRPYEIFSKRHVCDGALRHGLNGPSVVRADINSGETSSATDIAPAESPSTNSASATDSAATT